MRQVRSEMENIDQLSNIKPKVKRKRKQKTSNKAKVKTNVKKRLKKYVQLLTILKKLKASCRGEIISHLGEDAVNFLSECISQTIDQTSFLNNRQQNKIKKLFKDSKNDIRALANPTLSQTKKKKYLTKHGAGIGTILATVLPFIASLFIKK